MYVCIYTYTYVIYIYTCIYSSIVYGLDVPPRSKTVQIPIFHIYIYTPYYITHLCTCIYIYIYFLLLYLSILHVCACDAARFGPVLVTNHTEGCVDLDLCMNTSICIYIYIYMYIITHRYQLLTLS